MKLYINMRPATIHQLVFLFTCLLPLFAMADSRTINISEAGPLDYGTMSSKDTSSVQSITVVVGAGASAETITIDAYNSDYSAADNFQVSFSSGSGFASSINFVASTDGESKTVYVRAIANADNANSKNGLVDAYDEGWANYDEIDLDVAIKYGEIEITGNAVIIADGDATPATSDSTDFGSVLVGNYNTNTYTLKNTKGGPPNVKGDIKLIDVGVGEFISIGGTNADQFSVVAQPARTIVGLSQTTFKIRFTPTSAGAKSATITIENTDQDENPYNFSISGTGTAPEMDVLGNGQSIADGDASPTTSDHTDFGDLTGGTQDRTFTIDNGSGTGNLILSGTPKVALSGSGSSHFSVTAQPTSPVTAGGNTTFTVRFTAPVVTGVYDASLSIANTDSDENPYNFTIRGEKIGDATWDGSSSTSWNTADNWTPSGVPTGGQDVSIPAAPGNQPTVDADVAVDNLTLEPGAKLTISSGQTLTVNGNFYMQANATKFSSLLDEGTLSITGTTSIECYLDGSNYHFISPPVSSFNVENGFDGYYGKKYVEANKNYSNLKKGDALVAKSGYSFKNSGTGANPVTFTGTYNTGNQTITSLANTEDSDADYGWHIVGNPYPSAIDWDPIEDDASTTNIESTIYVYDEGTGTYLTRNGSSGGTLTNGIIPPMQAFWVRASSDVTPGQIAIQFADRSHQTGTYLYKKGEKEESLNKDYMILKVRSQDRAATDDDKIYIQFDNEATAGFDLKYDGYKLFRYKGPELYTSIYDDSLKLGLEVRPDQELLDSVILPLGFKASAAGDYVISLEEHGFDKNTELELRDLSTSHMINLKQDTFNFTSSIVENLDRFELLIKKPVSLVSEPSDADICAGSSHSFAVTASNASGFQWQKVDGVDWNNMDDDLVYQGTQSATLSIQQAGSALDKTRYRCLVSNHFSADTTAATLLSVADAIAVTASTNDTMVLESYSIDLHVASNVEASAYQWQVNEGNGWESIVNNSNYTGSGTAALSIQNVPLAFNDYLYRCYITNACGADTSAPTQLKVEYVTNITPDLPFQKFTVFTDQGVIYVHTDVRNATKGSIIVFEMTGKEVLNEKLKNKAENSYTLKNAPTGEYVIKILTPDEVISNTLHIGK